LRTYAKNPKEEEETQFVGMPVLITARELSKTRKKFDGKWKYLGVGHLEQDQFPSPEGIERFERDSGDHRAKEAVFSQTISPTHELLGLSPHLLHMT
jgi:hypothetical protein